MIMSAHRSVEPTTVLPGSSGIAVAVGCDRRADGNQRHISLTRDCIRIDRTMRGIAMRVAVPVKAYRGVALSLQPDADGILSYQLALVHQDGDLSVTLDKAADDNDIVADWRLWSRFFRLPALVEREAGLMELADETLGGLTLGRQDADRRASRARFKRRPRFLQRRKMGASAAVQPLHAGEREIIARD